MGTFSKVLEDSWGEVRGNEKKECKGKRRGKTGDKKVQRTSEKERWKWQEVKKREGRKEKRERRERRGNRGVKKRKESAGGLIFNVINEL